MQPRQILNLGLTLLLMAVFGFLMPLTFARRITAIGLLACLGGCALAAASAVAATHEFGGAFTLPAWGAINLFVAVVWIKFVLHLGATVQGERQDRAAKASQSKPS